MALRVNQSGTWRNITSVRVNDSGTWRTIPGSIGVGRINVSGTWRSFIGATFGDSLCGGTLVARCSNIQWIAAPVSVQRSFNQRGDAITRAQQVSGVSGWFVPTAAQLQNPGIIGANVQYWSDYSSRYMSNETVNEFGTTRIAGIQGNGNSFGLNLNYQYCAHAFRCVSY